ncbi:OmpA family protein [Paracoccus litorisediminis]|uniref:OmpA family protein n=1 Tax=Paracoccus litorisediminis TaxID=2006130 RepID=UPI00372EEB16
MSEISRRLILAGGLATLAAPALALGGATLPAPELTEVIDPWAGRMLTMSERINVETAATRLLTRIGPNDWVDHGMMDNHYRIRMPAHRLFKSRTDQVLPFGVGMMTLLAEALAASKGVRIEIVSHCEIRDNTYGAFILTQRRSAALRAVLMSRGTDGARVKPTGLGDRFPIAQGHDDAAILRNRRVEFLIRPL